MLLYGDEYLAKDMDAHLYHLISPLYLANRNVTLDEYNNRPKADIDPFHYVFYLWKMGATVVGVPSSLATNTYMEGTPYQLPLTGIGGGLSNSLQAFVPEDAPEATVLYPKLMPGYSDYKSYGFDKHAEILYLLDVLKCR